MSSNASNLRACDVPALVYGRLAFIYTQTSPARNYSNETKMRYIRTVKILITKNLEQNSLKKAVPNATDNPITLSE